MGHGESESGLRVVSGVEKFLRLRANRLFVLTKFGERLIRGEHFTHARVGILLPLRFTLSGRDLLFPTQHWREPRIDFLQNLLAVVGPNFRESFGGKDPRAISRLVVGLRFLIHGGG